MLVNKSHSLHLALQLVAGLHRECIGVVDGHIVALVRGERGRPRETIYQLLADVLTTNRLFMPPESFAVVAFPEHLAECIDSDELRPLQAPDARGDVLGTDILVGEFDEDTLDERHDRFVTPVVGYIESKVGPWHCRCIGLDLVMIDTTVWIALSLRMHVLLRGSTKPRHP